MKKTATFFLILTLFSGFSFAQQNAIFLNSHVLNEPGEVELHLPTGFFSGTEVAGYDTTLIPRILNAMNALYAKDRPFAKHGVGVAISIPGRPQWSGTIGMNDDTSPMDTSLAFEIASNTKTFVTALIMKLQDEGKISIKDTIGKWLPRKYPNVDGQITVEQLLNHSSGIFDYINDDPTLFEDFFVHPSTRWTPDKILDTYVGAPNFKAGTSYRYSNTNFLLLGIIAERAGGEKLGTQLHTNFIDPLKLTHTFFGGVDSVTIPIAHNWTPYDTSSPEIDYVDLDKTALLSGSWSVGNIISTPGDLVQWVNQLYTGRVVSKSALKQMMTVHKWPDNSYYGLGTQLAPYYTKSFYGHSGSLVGFKSAMFTNPADSVSVVAYMNSDAVYKDVTTNDYLVAILNEIYRVVKTEVSQAVTSEVSVSVYPNPASEYASFYFRTDKEGDVKLSLFDELGRQVKNLVNEPLAPGNHSASCTLKDLHTGTYLYRLQNGTEIATGKLVVN